MLEWFLQAVYDGDEELVYFIAEKINFEYETLCNIIDSKNEACVSIIGKCCEEITRLERENKKLKSELERIKK